MKFGKLFWGLGLILLALLILLDVLGILSPFFGAVGEVSLFALVAGFFLLCLLLKRLLKGKLSSIFFPLAFLFMLFEKNVAYVCKLPQENIINNWLLLLIALLLTTGFSILLPGGKHKHLRIGISSSDEEEDDDATKQNALGSRTLYINSRRAFHRTVENHLGSCNIYFENVNEYSGEGVLTVENNLGTMQINVPSTWSVVTDIDNTLGHYSITKQEDGGREKPVLLIKGENNLGSLNIRFV